MVLIPDGRRSRDGGFSGAPLITKERQPAIKPTPHTEPSVSRVRLKVWLNPNKHLTLIWPSLPLGEMSQAREYPHSVGAIWFLTKKEASWSLLGGKEDFQGGLEFPDFSIFSYLDDSIL